MKNRLISVGEIALAHQGDTDGVSKWRRIRVANEQKAQQLAKLARSGKRTCFSQEELHLMEKYL